jgi:ribosomal protein L11 methyltransferase
MDKQVNSPNEPQTASHTPTTPEHLKKYLSLTYHIPEEQYEQAYAALAFVQHVGITEGFDEISICFLINNTITEQDTYKNKANILFNEFNIQYDLLNSEIIVEENWNKSWEDSIEPIHINNTAIITPSWKVADVKREIAQSNHTAASPLVITINPQMSFGTGHHETTSMMAELLYGCVEPDSVWVDAGTGTGLLAILAVMRGARNVFAFDNDEWSVLNTKENIALNALDAAQIRIEQADVHTVSLTQAHGIAANLHKNLIKPNLQRFHDALTPHNGSPAHLLLSGILRYDAADIIEQAQRIGFRHEQTKSKGDWIAIHFFKD